ADQPFAAAVLADLLLGPGILVHLSLAILEQPSLLSRIVLGISDDPLGPLGRGRFQEIAATHLQAVIDKLIELAWATDGQMALEDHPVKAGENPEDQAGKLGHEGAYFVHGHPSLSGWLLVTTIVTGRVPVSIPLGWRAQPALSYTPTKICGSFRSS